MTTFNDNEGRVAVSGLTINTCFHSLQFPLSLAAKASVTQHLQYGINSLSKFAKTHHLPLLRGTSRRIISPMPSLRPASPFFPLRHAHASYSALQLTMRALQMTLLYCIVLAAVLWCTLQSLLPINLCT